MALLDDFPDLTFEVREVGNRGQVPVCQTVGSELGIPPQPTPPLGGVVGGVVPDASKPPFSPISRFSGKVGKSAFSELPEGPLSKVDH